MYYHVYIELATPEGESEVKLGLTEDELRRRILKPYEQGTSFVVNGRAIRADNVKRLSVRRGTTPTRQLLATARAQERASSLVVLGHDMVPYDAFKLGDDVTDEFVQGPPGWRRPAVRDTQRDSRRVATKRRPARRGKRSATRVTTARAACKVLGREWASIKELSRLTRRSASAVRSRIWRVRNKMDEPRISAFDENDCREFPSPQTGMPRQEYRIEGVWPLLFPNVRMK